MVCFGFYFRFGFENMSCAELVWVWSWGLSFCLTLHWLTNASWIDCFWKPLLKQNCCPLRIAPLQVGYIYLETLLSVLFETKLFLKTAFEAKLLPDIDWLIVASSGLRGKRPIRRSGKKLPTFCVFCKVIVFHSLHRHCQYYLLHQNQTNNLIFRTTTRTRECTPRMCSKTRRGGWSVLHSTFTSTKHKKNTSNHK